MGLLLMWGSSGAAVDLGQLWGCGYGGRFCETMMRGGNLRLLMLWGNFRVAVILGAYAKRYRAVNSRFRLFPLIYLDDKKLVIYWYIGRFTIR